MNTLEKPHFLLGKVRFTEIYIIISYFGLKNIDYGYMLEPPHQGTICVWTKNKENTIRNFEKKPFLDPWNLV